MLRIGAYVMAGFLAGTALMWFWGKSDERSWDYELYAQLSSDALIALTPFVTERRHSVVGVLHAWRHDDDISSLVLIPDKSWLNVNIDLAPSAVVTLRSTTDNEAPMVNRDCLGKFVMVDGLARQSLGAMSLFDIYEILIIEKQGGNLSDGECLLNKPSLSSLHGKIWGD